MTWVVHNIDCRDFIKATPDAAFDAVVTDPPFGINFAGQPTKWQRQAGMKARAWDETAPEVSFLLELAPKVIVWGGNYFNLPTSRGWMAWTKPDAPPSMGNVELAWTNVDRTAKAFSHSISATNRERVGHPTQKPIAVMKWCMDVAGIPVGATVFDPFCGSGTTGVACLLTGRNFVGCEIDPEYANMARQRCREAEESIAMFTRTG